MASGSGLGLAIARELAKLMGGTVRLESEGQPTVFTLDLQGAASPDRPPATRLPFSRENGARDAEQVPRAS
jgi:signal transduction histidine kinase